MTKRIFCSQVLAANHFSVFRKPYLLSSSRSR